MPTANTTKPPVLLLALMAIASPIALNIYAPLMPLIKDQLGSPQETVQLGFSLYLAALAVGQLLAGPLADRFGARPILLWGFSIHLLGCGLLLLANDMASILIGRCLQAAGGCTGMLLARSIVLKSSKLDDSGSALAYISLGIASSQALAPTLGAYIGLWLGWKPAFIISLAIAMVILLLAYRYLSPEPSQIPSAPPHFLSQSIANYRQIIKSQTFIKLSLANACITSAYICFINNMPFIVTESLGGSAKDFGNWFLWVAGGFWLGSLIAGRISAKTGVNTLLLRGNVLAIMAAVSMLLLCLYLPLHFASFFICMAAFTFGRGLSQPSAQAIAVKSCPQHIASANALFAAVQLVLSSLTAQLSAYWVSNNSLLLPVVILSLGLISLALTVSNKGAKAASA